MDGNGASGALGHESFDAIVIGAGSAGLAAAVALRGSGDFSVLVLEREPYVGGVLPQCVHDGFGLYCFGESLTGPEYAMRWQRMAQDAGAVIALRTTVLSVEEGPDGGYIVDAVGQTLGGHARMHARAVICASGCRERSRGALQIPGGRPAGVYTAGTAQYMVNIADQMPGDKIVILGSGDIGLIMARRMTLEGAEVRLVLGQEATGLVRNHIRCIQDFRIPMRAGWGVVKVHGFGQLQAVTVAPLEGDGGFDMERAEYVRCNALLLACGLIPEREVLAKLDAGTEHPGLFLAGNANVPHDLVDQVTREGLELGVEAARYIGACGGPAAHPLPDALALIVRREIAEPKGRMNELYAGLGEGQRRVVCTGCPTGCAMTIDADGSVRGNGCPAGLANASSELACPKRIFTGTVRVDGDGLQPMLLPVRTSSAVPLSRQMDVARACRRIRPSLPIAVGDAVACDVAGTGADLIATGSLGRCS